MTVLHPYLPLSLSLLFLCNAFCLMSVCNLLVTKCNIPLSLLVLTCFVRRYIVDKWPKYSLFVALSKPLSLIKIASNRFVLLIIWCFGSGEGWIFLTSMWQLFSFTGWTCFCFVRLSISKFIRGSFSLEKVSSFCFLFL